MASETLSHFSKESPGSPTIKRQAMLGICALSAILVLSLVILGGLNSFGLLHSHPSFDVARSGVQFLDGGRVNGHAITTTEVVVRPGDTLWAIARSTGLEGRDVREVIDWIRQLNDLQSGSLRIGQVLLVPVMAPNP